MSNLPASPAADPALTPYCLDSERALLGALINDGAQWPVVRDLLRAEDFFAAGHQALFRGLMQQLELHPGVSFASLKQTLAGEPEALASLTSLPGSALPTAELLRLARRLHKKFFLRQMLQAQQELGFDFSL